MASPQDNISMALFCDFENVALGVRDANYDKFDIKKVLERLLLKGSIVVKKAYCDWDRYRTFKGTMHEANFELIEIPHVRQSGKNSADIRMVVDALDLCYTKSHVNTFVIISGDSDFSPLVSKLRENAKYVIGVGVKQSTSDLLTANCDEFIFYDDLVREGQRVAARRESRDSQPSSAPRRSPEEDRRRKEEMDARRGKAIEMAVDTYEALVTDRDDGGKIWASVLKEALKRRNPGFNESYFGFRTFGNLLEEAQARGLLEFGRDEKSGAYVFRSQGSGIAPRPVEHMAAPMTPPPAAPTAASASSQGRERPPAREPFWSFAPAPSHAADPQDEEPKPEPSVAAEPAPTQAKAAASRGRRRRRNDNEASESSQAAPAAVVPEAAEPSPALPPEQPQAAVEGERNAPRESGRRRAPRGGRKTAASQAEADSSAPSAEVPVPAPMPEQHAADDGGSPEAAARKTSARGRRPRKKTSGTPE